MMTLLKIEIFATYILRSTCNLVFYIYIIKLTLDRLALSSSLAHELFFILPLISHEPID